MSRTDGRRLLIGDAHEDFYEPVCCIYNDVEVTDSDTITIDGYQEDVFPPTDYATATQVGDEIWILDNLENQEHRCDGPAQVRWLFTPNDQGNLNTTNELVADATPDHNLFHGH